MKEPVHAVGAAPVSRKKPTTRIIATAAAFLVVAAAVIAAAVVAKPPAAQAAIGAVTCSGGIFHLDFKHPTTNAPFGPIVINSRTFNTFGTVTFYACGSLTNPEINGNATMAITPNGTSNGSCTNGGTLNFKGVSTYANGAKSTSVVTATVTANPPAAIVTANITEGLFSGPLSTATTLLPTFVFNPIACGNTLGAGMTAVDGTLGLTTLVSPL